MGCGIEPRAEIIFLPLRKRFDGRVTVSQFGSLPDRGLSVTDPKRVYVREVDSAHVLPVRGFLGRAI